MSFSLRFSLLFLCVWCVVAQESNHKKHDNTHMRSHKNAHSLSKNRPYQATESRHHEKLLVKPPFPNNHYEQHKNKRKTVKSRRTVQKIIKPINPKKVYMHNEHLGSHSTKSPMKKHFDQKDLESDESLTKETTKAPAKKFKKKNLRLERNQMPFHKFKVNQHRRQRRDLLKDNTNIINDLDDTKVIETPDGYNVVSGHFKQYWAL